MLEVRDVFYNIMSNYEKRFARLPRFDFASLPSDVMYDALYGKITIDKQICYLLAFPIVERLRNIKQLALTELMYTGASHTRLEHSLGVSYLLTNLASDADDKDKIVLSIIGLLHDVGHSGWGHALDGISSRVVSEISQIEGQETFPIFSPKKLDMVITSYLLYHNDQLTSALTQIAKSISPWRQLPFGVNSAGTLRDFVAWVISEEEDGHLQYCRNWLQKATLMRDLAHYYEHLLGFKVNADRLDWIERDAHHAFSSVEFGKLTELKDFGLIKSKLRFRQGSGGEAEPNTPSEWDKLRDVQPKVRELLYTSVYEGIPRSFMDSLLTRAVYASIVVLSNVGNQIAGTSAKARVIMGYVFSPDSQLRSYTEDVLTSAYFSASWAPPLTTSSQLFVRNTYDLWVYLFENLGVVLPLLKIAKTTSHTLSSLRIAGDISINEKRFSVMYLDGLWLSTVIGTVETWIEAKQVSKWDAITVWHAISEYLGMLRTDTIRAFYTEEIETKINKSEDLDENVSVYILPNYYFLRKLMDEMPDFIEKQYDGKSSIIEKFIEHLEKGYAGRPMIFVIVAGDTGRELTARTMEVVSSLLTSHLGRQIGDRIFTVLGSPATTTLE